MITRDDWMIYIKRINEKKYTIAFEHSKKTNRRVYIIDIVCGKIVVSCTYQAYRKYRKYLHIIPGSRCNRLH